MGDRFRSIFPDESGTDLIAPDYHWIYATQVFQMGDLPSIQ